MIAHHKGLAVLLLVLGLICLAHWATIVGLVLLGIAVFLWLSK